MSAITARCACHGAPRALRHIVSSVFCVLSIGLVFFLGQDFFPQVDAGIFRMHVRGRAGCALKKRRACATRWSKYVRHEDPAKTSWSRFWTTSVCPTAPSTIPTAPPARIGTSDAEILVSLNQEKHQPTEEYVKQLREESAAAVSRRGILFPAGGHRQPDSELRLALAH